MEDEKLSLDKEKLALDRERFVFEQQKHLRDRWWLEEGVVNQRLTWLLTAQAFIGAGYAYIRQQSGPSTSSGLKALGMTLPFFGIALCAVVILGLYAAHQAQDELTKMASKGAIGNTGFVRYGGRLVPILITWLFLLGWVGVYFLT